ncbi:hypothetical protein AB0G54_36520 [Streptomyces yokosukanensis]|uniref:hypothetical protein n=1 Tax=Streptomyces yokosukanensis TaxID=67386 RepID=UPI00343470DB
MIDVNWMDRADRRRRGKSDPLDAQNAARAVLSGRACARAEAGDGPVQIARMYKLTKASAVKARTRFADASSREEVGEESVLQATRITLGATTRNAWTVRRRSPRCAMSARREIVRCLNRYAAREVFHLVRQLQPAPRS